MFKGKNIFIISIIFIIIGGLGIWGFLFQNIDTKIKEDIESGKHVVLIFSAEWCSSCKKQKPIYQKVKREFPETNFYLIGPGLSKVEQKLLFKYYNVKGLPHFIVFKNGKEQMRTRGFKTEEKLKEVFSK